MEKEKDLRLTPRELEILQLTAKGLEQTQIAEILGISFATVVAHRKKLFKKLGVHNAAEAVYEAIPNGAFKGSKMKKRNKKYRPKRTHAPSFIYSLTLGELTEGDRARSDIHPYVHLDVLRRGEGNEEDAWHVQSALRHAWVLSQGFEEKTTMRLTFLLAFASLNCMAQLKKREDPELPDALFEPVDMALEYLKQMKDSCNRSELLKSMWALEASGHIFDIPTGSGFLVDPVNDDDFDKVQGRGGFAVINKKTRRGWIERNEAMNRWEWHCHDEDVVVPITKPFVLLLYTPIKP